MRNDQELNKFPSSLTTPQREMIENLAIERGLKCATKAEITSVYTNINKI
jgi:hypothetical protein